MSEGTLLGLGFFGGIALAIVLLWIRELIIERIRIRRNLEAIKPRTTVELEGSHEAR